MAVKAFTEEGDSILIQQPVYYPFSEVIRDNHRVVVSNDLYLGEDNRYHIDFEDFEAKITQNKVKMFFLCNPHNPVGRVWTREELEIIGDICVKHGVIVVSDDIHHDFVYEGTHTVFSAIKKEFEDIAVICTSPNKTFNIAGMLISNIFIPNEQLRIKFQHQVNASGIDLLSVTGLIATQAAYEHGDEWYQAMISYVKQNIELVKEFVTMRLPSVSMIESEGTYLVWLDFRKTGIDAKDLDYKLIHEAKLWLDSGSIFGKEGEGFQRVNVAAPRSIIEEMLHRLEKMLQ